MISQADDLGATRQNKQQVNYDKLKGFASFILADHLEEATRLSLDISRKFQMPLGRQLAPLSEDQLHEQAKKGLAEFFEQMIRGTALREAEKTVISWKNNKIKEIDRNAVQASDIILAYSVRKQLILQLLPAFTSDCEEIVGIMQELEVFYQQLEQFAFDTYLAIQQEELNKQNSFLNSLINNSMDGVLAFDLRLNITAWNPSMEKSLSKSRAEVLGKPILHIFPALENSPLMAAFRRSLEGKQTHLPVDKYIYRSGAFEAKVTPLYDRQNRIKGGLAHVHDVTYKVQAEERLKEYQEELLTANEELTEQREELQAAVEELSEQRQEMESMNEELQESLAQLKEAQEKLQQLVSQLEEAQEIAHLGSFEYLIESEQLYWSKGLKRIFGLPDSQLPFSYQEYLSFIYEEDLPLVRTTIEQAIESREPYQFEHRIVHANGSIRWILAKGKPFVERGKLVKLKGTALDITERKLAELQIKEEQHFIQKVTDTTPDVITVFDLEKKANIYGNRELSDVLGYSKEEVEALRQDPEYIQKIVHPEDLEKAIQFLQSFRTEKGTDSKEIEYRARLKSGNYIWVMARYRVFKFNKKGLPSQLIGITRNINARKLAEQDLQQAYYRLQETNEELQRTEELLKEANDELEEQVLKRTAELRHKNNQLTRINADLDNFIYTASHDLKAPISNLEGLLVLLNKKLSQNLAEKDQKLVGMMHTSVERLKKTILDLSDVTKMQKELEEEEKENLLLEELIEDVRQDISSLISENKAQIHLQLKATAFPFDRKNMRSIMYNLLSNAIKYRSPDRRPEIYLTTEAVEGGMLLSVRDNGEGIPEKQKDKIFSLFKRLHKKVEGSGMGLYIVKKIIDNNGGNIEVVSEVGKGTTFNIYLQNGTEIN